MKLPKLPFGVSYKALIMALLLGGLVAVFAYVTYVKREAIVFAYTNSNQVVELKEAYGQEIKTAELRLSKNVSRSYLEN